jgi:hypothetical protein
MNKYFIRMATSRSVTHGCSVLLDALRLKEVPNGIIPKQNL